MKPKFSRLGKKTASFFNQLCFTPKILAVVGYMGFALLLFEMFADQELLADPTQYATSSFVIHVACIAFALIIFCFMLYALGTCLYTRLDIKTSLPNAGLPERKGIAQPKLILFIPHEKKPTFIPYVEYEFRSKGIPAERWVERKRALESALNITIMGEIGHSEDLGIITFNARKGPKKPRREVLYDE